MAIVRGDRSHLVWKTESAFGVENPSGSWRRFGITHSAVCPDPEYDYKPQRVHGEGRKWEFMPGDAREQFIGSIPDIWLQDGRILKFLLGGEAHSDLGSYNLHTLTIPHTDIDSFTWEVTEYDDTPQITCVRRYLGCKVNRATLEARADDVLILNIDEVIAQNMIHNKSSVAYKYNNSMSQNYVTPLSTQPYHFHEGSLDLFGTTFGTVLDFRIDISNEIEPRYYIQRSEGEPVPHLIPVGLTNIGATATIEIEDAELFEALLTKGVYSSEYKGFMVYLEFRRGQSSIDTVKFTLGSESLSPSVTDPGCFIRRASGRVVDTPLIPIEIELEVPNLIIEVKDQLSASDWS